MTVVPDDSSASKHSTGPEATTGSSTAALASEVERSAEGPVPAYVWLFLLGLVSNVLSGTSGVLLGLPLSPDRPLLLLSVVLLILDPRRGRLRARTNQALAALLVAWVAWSWVSTGSIFDTYKAFALSDRIVLPILMFMVGPLVFADRRSRELLLKWLTVLGVYLGVTAVFEIFGPPSLVFPRGILAVDPGDLTTVRARGPFLSSEALGMSVTLISVMSAVLAARTSGRWRGLAVFCSVVCAFAAVISLTRSVWIGDVLIILLCLTVVRPLRRLVPALIPAGIVVVLLVIALAPSFVDKLTSRADTSRSVYDRLLTNDAAVRILDYHPLFGVGWGRFLDVTDIYVRQASTYPITTTKIIVHNVFLSLAADTGIPGAVLWGLVMLTGPVAVVVSRYPRSAEMQAWRLIAACALLVWIVPTLTSPNPYPFPNNLIWLVGGIAGSSMLVRPRRTNNAAESGSSGDQGLGGRHGVSRP